MRGFPLELRRARRVLAGLVVVLLLALQQQAQWHAYAHFGGVATSTHEQALTPPHDDGPCAICALLASGASAAPNEGSAALAHADAYLAPSFELFSATAAAPSFYLTRAPPLRS